MTTVEPVDLDAVQARADAATPGPWRWTGNTDIRELHLVAMCPQRPLVMGFRRWGMTGAQPVLATGRDLKATPKRVGLMTPAAELVRYEVAPDAVSREDPAVYRADISAIRHPDAEFIAHAREDIDALLAEVRALREQLAAAEKREKAIIAEAAREVVGLAKAVSEGHYTPTNERTTVAKERRGICPECNTEYNVTKAGGMRDHWSAPEVRSIGNWTCPGVGQPPKSLVADPVAAAEERGYQRAIDALGDQGALLTWWWAEVGEDRFLDFGTVHRLMEYLESLRGTSYDAAMPNIDPPSGGDHNSVIADSIETKEQP